MGELAELFKRAEKELKFGYLHSYDKAFDTHNFRGAIVHYIAGHESCENVKAKNPYVSFLKVFQLEEKFENKIVQELRTTLELLAAKQGWNFHNAAMFCEKYEL